MAFALLNPLSALWRERGLECLLMPEGFDGLAARTRGGALAAGERAAPARQPENRPRPGSERPEKAARHEGRTTPAQRAAPENAGRARPPQAVGGTPSARPGGQEALVPPSVLPPHVWPAPWRRHLDKARPGLVLWTYWNLGRDLHDGAAEGRTERRAFLQRLLRDLGHPAGTHTFWPACLPVDPTAFHADPEAHRLPPGLPQDGYAPHAEAFWSGARRLGARGAVVMGSTAARALDLPGRLRPPQTLRHRGHLVWVLWDVDRLLAEDERRYSSVLAFLRQALRQIVR